MDRVAFILEPSQQRVPCLLNPETLVVRRQAHVAARRSLGGPSAATPMRDDPVFAAGGGVTELDLDLLFDLALPGTATPTGGAPEALLTDVRDLTRPLHELTETRPGEPRLARLVWGRSWNVPCVVVALAERYDDFTDAGVPRRSWVRLRLRLRRVELPTPELPTGKPLPPAPADIDLLLDDLTPPSEADETFEPPLPTDDEFEEAPPLRLDQLGDERYGDPSAWRLLAGYAGLDDPLAADRGALPLPPRDAWGGLS